ncbi:DUF4145 domain-containing protein [Desulfogranum marinum]|uniref:DUF4145 domain-containing protein n=1 Tax=Desulfogranum marinum TaxID=453220 RepID=UPI001963D6F9|nr:DUF4145 domain-containing protein [Desulfogranum marinum]MBM9514686.1 DUF4145 domain-containing protein [Desulfogranum marinum]
MSDTPKYKEKKFKCPHCHVIAQQSWFTNHQLSSIISGIYHHIYLDYRVNIQDYSQKQIVKFLNVAKSQFPRDINTFLPANFSVATYQSCKEFSLWVDSKIVYPLNSPISPPNEDLSDEIKSIYNEASIIFQDSPKGSTALLRLALQKLLKQIGKDGKNINNDIKELVTEGLTPKIQKALDLVRVVGNNAVHPGQIDLDDNSEIASTLFKILNLIADELITRPKEIDNLYEDIIPDETKNYILQRDSSNN